MGRGRAKAKQVKVARQLKYNSGGTDLDRLRNELGVSPGAEQDEPDPYDDDSSAEDLGERYSDYAEDRDENDGGKGPKP